MAESLHKGWLYARDGIKFAPYSLKENILDRDGSAWGTNIDTTVNQLSGEVTKLIGTTIPELEKDVSNITNRATILETRTQYIDTSDNSKIFYVTGENGSIILQADNDGVKGYDFILPGSTSVKNSLLQINSNIASLANRATSLETRTQYIDTSDSSNALYITDESGDIIAQIDDANGIMSYKFTIKTGNTKISCIGYEATGNKITVV